MLASCGCVGASGAAFGTAGKYLPPLLRGRAVYAPFPLVPGCDGGPPAPFPSAMVGLWVPFVVALPGGFVVVMGVAAFSGMSSAYTRLSLQC